MAMQGRFYLDENEVRVWFRFRSMVGVRHMILLPRYSVIQTASDPAQLQLLQMAKRARKIEESDPIGVRPH